MATDHGMIGSLKPASIEAAANRQALRRGALHDQGARLFALGQALQEAEREGHLLPTLTEADVAEIVAGELAGLRLGSLLASKARQQARAATRRSGQPTREMQLAAGGEPRSGSALAALSGSGEMIAALRRQLGASFGSARGRPGGLR